MLKIYCVGDNNVDIYLNQGIVFPGGCALNVAAYAAMLGHEVTFVSSVGNDELGKLQLGSLKDLGVDVSKAHVIDVQTGWTYIILRDGDRIFGNNCSGAKKELPVSVEDVAFGQNGDYDFLYTSTDAFFAPGAFEQFGKSDIPAFCDFSSYWTRESLKAGCGIFSHVAMSCSDMSLLEVKALLKNCVEDGAKMAVGTMGMNGSYIYNGRKFYYQEAYASSVVDTLGAGDSFLAMFATSYFDGLKELSSCSKLLCELDGMMQNIQECEDNLIRKSMSFAALYAAKTCQNHGAFGHEIPFDYSMVARSDCDYMQEGRIS